MIIVDYIKDYLRDSRDLWRKRFKRTVLAAPFWVLAASAALITAGIIRICVQTDERVDQNMARYYQYGAAAPYRQLSVFARGSRSEDRKSPLRYLSPSVSLSREEVAGIREKLQNLVDSGAKEMGFTNKGLTRDGEPRNWADCYSSVFVTDISIAQSVTDKKKKVVTETSEVVAVGGSYTVFHPFKYMSGGFLPVSVINRNQVVVNDALAWRFYNSYNVTGNRIVIGDETFTIIGVVKERGSSAGTLAGDDKPRAFVYFDALQRIFRSSGAGAGSSAGLGDGSGDPVGSGSFSDPGSFGSEPGSGSSEGEFAIQCYEVMLPELVRGVAITDIKESIDYSSTDPQKCVVSNTGRFGLINIVDWIFPLGASSVELSGYDFPYWESAAQVTMTRIFLDYLMIGIGIVLLVIGVIMVVLKVRKFKGNEDEGDSELETDEGAALIPDFRG